MWSYVNFSSPAVQQCGSRRRASGGVRAISARGAGSCAERVRSGGCSPGRRLRAGHNKHGRTVFVLSVVIGETGRLQTRPDQCKCRRAGGWGGAAPRGPHGDLLQSEPSVPSTVPSPYKYLYMHAKVLEVITELEGVCYHFKKFLYVLTNLGRGGG